MSVLFKCLIFLCMVAVNFAVPCFSQNALQELRIKVDVIVATAYKQASVKFPCKLSTAGKAKMGNWKNVENCVNPAHDLVDWDVLSEELWKIREQGRYQTEDMIAVMDASLTAQAIPYEKVFTVKQEKALLPLSNSLLKFLPPDSLAGLPVYDKQGSKLGTFAGSYATEKSGGLESLRSYRMLSFQYDDLRGNIQTPTDQFLLDRYGVPWQDAKAQPGFRLPSDRFIPKH
jgi:hypothetical protein